MTGGRRRGGQAKAEVREALQRLREEGGREGGGSPPWNSVEEIRAWLQAAAPQQASPPIDAGEPAFARSFAWNEAKRAAEGDEPAHGGGEDGGRELRVMERVAAKLREALVQQHAWFPVTRAAADADGVICGAQVEITFTRIVV